MLGSEAFQILLLFSPASLRHAATDYPGAEGPGCGRFAVLCRILYKYTYPVSTATRFLPLPLNPLLHEPIAFPSWLRLRLTTTHRPSRLRLRRCRPWSGAMAAR